MKKLFLLLAAGISVSAVSNAQEVQSIIMTNKSKYSADAFPLKKHAVANASASGTAGKTTDQLTGEWFCFTDHSTAQSITEYAAWPVYPDSNIYTGNFNWYLHGMGTSFDPTSPRFKADGATPSLNLNPVYPIPSFTVTSGNAYTVDKINIVGWYERIDDNVVDTLNIYLAYASSPGAYNVTWSFTGPVPWRNDSLLQVAEPVYDWASNSLNPDTVTSLIKITKILDAAAYADSSLHPTAVDQNGPFHLHVWDFDVPNGGLQVPAGGHVIAFVTFGSATQHPLGTDWDLANKWNHWTAAVNGENGDPVQVPGDWNGGLGAFTEDRYHIPGEYSDLSNGSAVLDVNYRYTPVYMADPWFGFHIKCPTCNTTSVKEVASEVSELNAYPNPANNEVNIIFTSANAGKTNVTVSNAIGQVVDSKVVNVKASEKNKVSFSTANLAGGVYFYTVEANGQRETNRFVVAH